MAKQRTRERILAAARSLFADKGYDGVTLREIAAAAGFSTGALFTSFASKCDLVGEIIEADREALSQVMRAAAADGGIEDRLLAMFEAGYGFARRKLPLLSLAVSVSWSPQLGAAMRDRLGRWPITDLVSDALRQAVTRGEIAPEVDVPIMSQMVWDCFVTNMGRAAFEDARPEDLGARFKIQMRIILALPMMLGSQAFKVEQKAPS